MKQLTLILTLFVLNSTCKAQLVFNYYVDTLEQEVKNALHFHEAYLNTFKEKDSLPDFSQYWSAADCKKYKQPDQMIYAISSDYPTYMFGNRKTILYIKPEKDYVLIKTLFANSDSSGVFPMAITNHYIQKDKEGVLHYINPITMGTSNWETTTIRNITWHYPSYHILDSSKAENLIQSITGLEKEWNLEPIPVQYYFANTKDEIMKLRGFDYSVDMGNRDKPTGISNDVDNIVYCHGLGENYFHETVHIYLNKLFRESPLLEGLAVFYGGSMGHDMQWHAKRLDKYLMAHQEIDLNDWDKFDYLYIDNYTKTSGTIKAILCHLAFKKDGIKGLKRIMAYKDFHEILKKEYNLKEKDNNKFLRNAVHLL